MTALPAAGQDTLVQIKFPSRYTTAIKPGDIKHSAPPSTRARAGATGLNALPLEMPQLNLIEGTRFTTPVIASNILDITHYPASTTVQLVVYQDGKAMGQCSGTMVAPDLVLTAGHCLLNPATRTIDGDEIVVVAAGRNVINDGALVTQATSAYVMNSYLNKLGKADVMLLRTSDPIGDHTGWMGIASVEDSIFNGNTVFHKFSFPARTYGPDSTRGRELHYNYGHADVLETGMLGINGKGANATAGQSGSALFYFAGDVPYAVGVSVYARLYAHQRITPGVLNALRPVIDASVEAANDTPYIMYPNPMRQSMVVKVGRVMQRYSLVVTSASGEYIRTQYGTDTDLFFIDRGSLPAGEYMFTVIDEKENVTRATFHVIN